MKCDLHLHSTASDGRLTPREIVKLAVEKGVKIISITDHDSVAGVEEALLEAINCPLLQIIPGVEINTDYTSGEVHVLGYFINYEDPKFVDTLRKIRESRVERAQKMIDKLYAMGMRVEFSRVQELARGESICRPHIAQALLEKQYIQTEKEAFDKYIGRNGPAYVEREKVQPSDAVKIIKKAGGLPVLAHPADIVNLDDLIIELKTVGLVGLEAYYGEYDVPEINRMVAVSRKYNLVATGGTDYHHFQDGRETPIGSVDIPLASIEMLYNLSGRHFAVN